VKDNRHIIVYLILLILLLIGALYWVLVGW